MQPKYRNRARPYYMDTLGFVQEIEIEDFYKDVETKFDTSGYLRDKNRLLSIGKNKKAIDMMKDELAWKIMTEG